VRHKLFGSRVRLDGTYQKWSDWVSANIDFRICTLRVKKTAFTILVFFLIAFALSLYGAWAMQWESENQFLHHLNPFQSFCCDLAGPGFSAALTLLWHTDAPEDAPNPWPVCWIVAPVSGVFWGSALSVVYIVVRYATRFLFRNRS
jgi:hypothetical protein